jgi:hypothetical protein
MRRPSAPGLALRTLRMFAVEMLVALMSDSRQG